MRKCCKKHESWSDQEDSKLIDYINVHGEGSWSKFPKSAGQHLYGVTDEFKAIEKNNENFATINDVFAGLHRCGKCCRLRWMNHLRPNIKRGSYFGEDEEDLIIRLYALLGNRWSLIAGRLPGRTDDEVRNHWHSHTKKKLIKMGVDPSKHGLKLSPLITFSSCNKIMDQQGDMQDESSGSINNLEFSE